MATESTSPDAGNSGSDSHKPANYDTHSNASDNTHASPSRPGSLPPFLNPKLVGIVNDPSSKIPQYAVRKQKIITLSESQFAQLKAGKLSVGALSEREEDSVDRLLKSLNDGFSTRVITMDCPETGDDGKPVYTVLLDWVEETTVPFPDLRLITPAGQRIAPISQANNLLVVSFDDGGGNTNNPPARPPITTAEPLNIQPSDFRPMAPVDRDYYKQYAGQPKSPAVAVLDTGLKFNLHNQHEEAAWPDPHVYRDANGQERRFVLAYQDDATNDCRRTMPGNSIGYCSLQAYRQPGFISQMKLLSTMVGRSYDAHDVINSPFDDCVLLIDPNAGLDIKNIKDARHGTSITAIIQQTGDDAPVLPVKAFDNLGYATLFDVLNGFNYILHRSKHTPIRVVNTSWIFGRDEPLLRKKIEQLLRAGILVIAAAGNEGQTPDRSLDAVNVYPACYSTDYPNVITVTSVRKTFFPAEAKSPVEDSAIGALLAQADRAGLGDLLDTGYRVVKSTKPVKGLVAVENYSKNYVNVGVVSNRGFFRSPFWKSPKIKGSSYACAFVSGFVMRQLRTDPSLLALVESGSAANLTIARKQLLEAMSGFDKQLADNYVAGGYYLDGYAAD